jgi:formamidopyrimidine-DNA glycosylase
MPELPDIEVYVSSLAARIQARPLERIRLTSASLLRSVDPPLSEAHGRTVEGLRRLGKRVVIALEGELFLVVHLMIAGRFQWGKRGAKGPGRRTHAAFDFPDGTLLLTEASTHKRATLHLVRGEAAVREHNPGGIEVFECSLEEFRHALVCENHTLKRSLTDPHLISGIGNAYSDEILHRARLSPVKLSQKLPEEAIDRLYEATRTTLVEWTERLRTEVGEGFPEKVTAFRDEMAVHGRYKKPCPVCNAPIQRIVYAQNEANYCARCQTGGKLLADRALSRLLKQNWPKTLEELEEGKPGKKARRKGA